MLVLDECVTAGLPVLGVGHHLDALDGAVLLKLTSQLALAEKTRM